MTSIVGTDIGGTFTDLVAWSDDGALLIGKAPTTSDLAGGMLDAIDSCDLEPSTIGQLRHGSTIVVNAVLERTGAAVTLVTTAGFEDVLEIGRGNRPNPFRLDAPGHAVLVPAARRLGVPERVAADGRVTLPLAEDAIAELIDELSGAEVEAVAVCLLHSYANPEHERRLVTALREALPSRTVVASHEVCQEAREFERTSTTVLHAYTGPTVRHYLGQLTETLKQRDSRPRLLIMQSNGGLLPAMDVERRPALMMESGPVSGVTGTLALSRALGIERSIAFDMGGTTAKASLVEGSSVEFLSTYYVGGYEGGLPLLAPVVDIHEVGAGGGSIAWLDDAGALHVGPRSAGSQPGPICYGRGGTLPTVCDADLVLGRLVAGSAFGGSIVLDEAAARQGVERRVALPLGLDVDRAAQGILDIATTLMAQAIRKVSIERGKDPRLFTLFAYGGAGPMHAADIARELEIPRVVVPRAPGVFSALGMLHTPLRTDRSRTVHEPLDAHGVEVARRHADQLLADIAGELPPGERTRDGAWVALRFAGQEHAQRVAVRTWELDELELDFAREYRRRYGYVLEHADVEVVAVGAWREATDVAPPWSVTTAGQASPAPLPDAHPHRMYLPDVGWQDAIRCWRPALERGHRIDGPALIVEPTSACAIGSADRATVGATGELVLEIG